MSRLFILGNGFDKAHGIACDYSDFGHYLEENNWLFYENIRNQKKEFEVSLRNMTIAEAWNSEPFERFRSLMRQSCPECNIRELCMGGCPLMPEIVFCDKKKSMGVSS